MNILNLENINQCYGCSACYSICNHDAITMKPNEEGFLFPSVDEEKCTNCGLCSNICLLRGPSKDLYNDRAKDVFAAWDKNIVNRTNSTSGGVFGVIATFFIEQGGIVFGAIWNENNEVVHSQIDKVENIDRLRGSKYIQSNLNSTFRNVKTLLLNGNKVLFSGTPCQVAGLKTFLRKEYSNLYTIDLICHGVPSPLIFSKYKKYLEDEHNAIITKYEFRAKKLTGWRSYERITFSNGKSATYTSGSRPYSIGFYNCLFSRESCFNCVFTKAERVGDITLSDFWNAEKVHKELKMTRKHGFNFVGLNNEKGKELFSGAKESLFLFESQLDVAIKGDIRFRKPNDRPEERDFIYKELVNNGFIFVLNKYLRSKGMAKFYPNFVKNIIREITARI